MILFPLLRFTFTLLKVDPAQFDLQFQEDSGLQLEIKDLEFTVKLQRDINLPLIKDFRYRTHTWVLPLVTQRWSRPGEFLCTCSPPSSGDSKLSVGVIDWTPVQVNPSVVQWLAPSLLHHLSLQQSPPYSLPVAEQALHMIDFIIRSLTCELSSG